MLALLVFIGLLVPTQPLTPQEAEYEAVLRAVQTEFPGSLLSVPNRPLSYLRNPPPSFGSDSLSHDPRWLAKMEQEGVIAFSCIPPRNFIGCPEPDSLAGRTIISVQFWPTEYARTDSTTVTVTLVLPPFRQGVANLEKREYALVRDPGHVNGWRVDSYKVTGVT